MSIKEKNHESMVTPYDDIYLLFKERAEAAGAEVHRATYREEAKLLIGMLIKQLKVEKVTLVNSPIINEIGLEQFLENKGIDLGVKDPRKDAVEADLGISEMDYAIADSGTLFQDAEDINKRLVSMLTRIHLAFIRTNKLVENMQEVLKKADQTNLPGYLACITGPSRTADIERILTIGVHGPEKLIIIFLDSEVD